MEYMPNELILIIFMYINKVTDKRQFVRTCKLYNTITKKLIKNVINNFKVKHFDKFIPIPWQLTREIDKGIISVEMTVCPDCEK